MCERTLARGDQRLPWRPNRPQPLVLVRRRWFLPLVYGLPYLLLALYLLAFLPVVFLVAVSFRQLARKVTRQGSRAMAAVNDNIQETVTGIGVAKNFRQEALVYEAFLGR